MKLDLTRKQITILEKTCQEEIKYYERCVLIAPGLRGQEAIDAGNDFLQGKNNKLRDGLAKATIVNIQEYRQIADKLIENNTDFDRRQLDKLRMMLQEIPPLYERHFLVKTQVDGTVTPKHVHGVLLESYKVVCDMLLHEYQEILTKIMRELNK